MKTFIVVWGMGQRDVNDNLLVNKYTTIQARTREEAVEKTKEEWGTNFGSIFDNMDLVNKFGLKRRPFKNV